MLFNCRFVAALLLIHLGGYVAAPSASAQPEPDVTQIAAAGRRTLARLQHEAASWTTEFEVPGGGATAQVDVTYAKAMWRFVIALHRGGHRQEFVRIVECDGELDLWQTCDLSGGDVRAIGDGLKNFGFPTVSPDSTRLMMMRFGSDNRPQTHVIDIATGKTYPLSFGPGFWARPVWR